jgi:hypothetical protein
MQSRVSMQIWIAAVVSLPRKDDLLQAGRSHDGKLLRQLNEQIIKLLYESSGVFQLTAFRQYRLIE